ncbi:MAG TPA: hypothetical protein VF862_04240 [Gemmatimonadales bacterium]
MATLLAVLVAGALTGGSPVVAPPFGPMAAQDLQISAEVDRDRIGIGEALTYTVRVLVEPGLPVQITPGPLDGFSLIGRAERREPGTTPGGAELLVLELRLRAQRAGLWRVGGVRFEQGIRAAISPEIEVAVEAGRAPAPSVGPRVQRMLARATPPAPGEVAVSLLVSDSLVVVGQQVDVVTAAWFPRDLLGRLRRPPTIRPPTVEGVYTAVQPSVAGVAASRLVGEVWYDIYVAHQVLFPVDEGTLRIPSAGLTYAVPAGRQYFTDEQAVERASPARSVTVRGLPPGGAGAVGTGLELGYELSPDPARAGQPIPVTVVLTGKGNLALWSSPTVRWPEGSRGYADGTRDALRLTAGEFGGTRRFRFLVVVDSAGTLALPELRYRYFDVAQGSWREATARASVLPVLPATPTTERRQPPATLTHAPLGFWRFTPAVWAVMVVLLVAPPLVAFRGRFRARARVRDEAPGLNAADQLVAHIRGAVPDADARREDRLASALRARGLDPALSAEAARLYGQLATRRFAPEGSGIATALEPATRQVLAAWPRRVAGLTVLLLMTGPVASALHAESRPDPVEWWADGAAAWETGQDARAAAMWIAARRLAPRAGVMEESWRRLASRSADLQSAGRVSPLTPVEWGLVAVMAWAVAWLAVPLRRRRLMWLAGSLALGAGLAGALVARAYARPIGVVSRAAVLRQAPHGLAAEAGTADPLAVVEVVSSRPGWHLVRSEAGLTGWLPEGAVLRVPR